jgi:hypothetical protein
MTPCVVDMSETIDLAVTIVAEETAHKKVVLRY